METRRKIIFFILAAWGLCCAFQLVRYTVLESGDLLQYSEKLSGRQGYLPVPRGRILSLDRHVLVHSEQHWFLHAPEDGKKWYAADQELIRQKYGELPARIDLQSLSEQEIKELLRLSERLNLRLERQVVRVSRYAEAGKCETDAHGILHGVSGWEKQYDHILSGTPGEFRASADSRGYWMRGTTVMLKDPVPGKDVYLPKTLAELEGEKKHE